MSNFGSDGRGRGTGVSYLEPFARETWLAVRKASQHPLTASVVVVILAVGIATCVTIYDTGRALATHAVPFPRPEQLINVALTDDRGAASSPSYQDFVAWESSGEQPLTLGAYRFQYFSFDQGDGSSIVPGSRVSGQFFSTLDVDPLIGRNLSPADEEPTSASVAILSQDLWEARFASDAAIVGRSVRIDGTPHTVVGVARTGLQYPAGVDLWIPLRRGEDDGSMSVSVIGRFEPTITILEVESILLSIHQSLGGLSTEPPDTPSTPRVEPLSGRPSDESMTALRFVQAAVLVLLLITAMNAAGVMHARTLGRRREIAIRMCLGAGNARMIRGLLTETTVLSFVAGALGLGLGQAATIALRNALPHEQSRNILGWDQLGLDMRSAAFAFGLSAVTAIVCGVLPALRVARSAPIIHVSSSGAAATEGRRGRRVLQFLLTGEVALALALLLTAGLLTRSYHSLHQGESGFHAEDVLTVQWTLPLSYSEPESIRRFQQTLLDDLAVASGIQSTGIVSNLPMSRSFQTQGYRIEGSDPSAEEMFANWRPSTPGYLGTLGIRLSRGRGIEESDGANAPRVALVSEALVRRHRVDGTEDVLGTQFAADDQLWTIVGVVADVHDFGGQQVARPTIYVPQVQAPTAQGFLALGVAAQAGDVPARIRRAIWDIDPDIALGEFRLLAGMVDDYYARERLLAFMMGTVALIAVLITFVSLFALVAQSVARRRREMGIQIALGASRLNILASAASLIAMPVGLGVGAGLGLALVAARGLSAILYGIEPMDPFVFTVLPVGLLAIIAVAGLVPARDAWNVEPVEAMRIG